MCVYTLMILDKGLVCRTAFNVGTVAFPNMATYSFSIFRANVHDTHSNKCKTDTCSHR